METGLDRLLSVCDNPNFWSLLDPWCDGVRLDDSCFFGPSDFARKERDIRLLSVCLSA